MIPQFKNCVVRISQTSLRKITNFLFLSFLFFHISRESKSITIILIVAVPPTFYLIIYLFREQREM